MRVGPREGSLGRKGGGRPLALVPDGTVTANAPSCAHCQAALTEADQMPHGHHNKIDLPVVAGDDTGGTLAGHARAAPASTWRRYLLAWKKARRSA